jgi:small subunit ribosomal protein S19
MTINEERSRVHIPFVDKNVIRQLTQQRRSGGREVIKTSSRSTMIIPLMIGCNFAIHNGRQYIPLYVSEEMIGHKLGEFAPSRTFRSHIKKDKKGGRGRGGQGKRF